MNKTKKVLKKYEIHQLDPEEGFHKLPLDAGESYDLRRTLFNKVCCLICTCPNIYKVKHDKIIKNIHQGKLKARESWYAFFEDDIIVSIIEIKDKKETQKAMSSNSSLFDE